MSEKIWASPESFFEGSLARAELEKNKTAQVEKFKAVKQEEAIHKFRMFMHLKRNHAALENKETKSAHMLHHRIKKISDELKSDPHFLHKDLLSESRPILMTKNSLPIFEGGVYEMSSKADAPAKIADHPMWKVTNVDLDKQEVTMRPVGYVSSSPYGNGEYTCKVDDLSTGMKMGKAVTQHEELKSAIATMQNPSGLIAYPESLVSDMEAQIQERLRAMMSAPREEDYHKPYAEQRRELYTINKDGYVRKMFPGDKDAATATFVLPISKYLKDLVRKAHDEKVRYSSGIYGGRRKHQSYQYMDRGTLNEVVGHTKAQELLSEYASQAKASKEAGKVFTPQDFRPEAVLSKSTVVLTFKGASNA